MLDWNGIISSRRIIFPTRQALVVQDYDLQAPPMFSANKGKQQLL